MKILQKKISLEQFKSRTDGIIPAYYNNGDKNYYIFDGFNRGISQNIEDNDFISQPYNNYGLVPFFIIWEYGVVHQGKTISYHQLREWYNFIEKYVNILSKNNCNFFDYSNTDINCEETDFCVEYENAQDYYKYNGSSDYTLEDCINFDNKIVELCGNITEEHKTLYINALNVLNSLTKDYFPKCQIPKKLWENWNKKFLSLGECQHWFHWFQVRDEKFNNKTLSEACNNDENCCCEYYKYIDLGGHEMFVIINNFLLSLKQNNIISKLSEPFFNITFALPQQIDNLGEVTKLSESWEGGVDYSTSEQKGGAVVEYNNNDWILKDNELGYLYSNIYKEYYFGTASGMTSEDYAKYSDVGNSFKNINQYARLIEQRAIDNNGDVIYDFNGAITKNLKYAYKSNGEKIFFNEPLNITLIKEISESYDINHSDLGYYFIQGAIIEVFNYDYIQYDGNLYETYKDAEGNPYVNINGLKYYSTYDNKSNLYVFHLPNITEDLIINNGLCISVNGKLFKETNNQVIINNITYNKVNDYCVINNEYVFLYEGETIHWLYSGNPITSMIFEKNNNTLGVLLDINTITNNSDGYFIDGLKLYVVRPFTIYDATKLTGYTESKLSSFLVSTDTVYDNIGNKLPGRRLLNDEGLYVELKDGDLLELLYKPKTVINLSKVYDNTSDVVENKYWGDYLDSIYIYYADENGNKITNEISLENNTLSQALTSLNEELGDTKYGDLYARFTYFLGCEMIINQASVVENLVFSGVKYNDTVKLEKKLFNYYINDYNFYILKYYDLIHQTINYKNEDYDFASTVYQTYFEAPITIFKEENQEFNCNGWNDFPVFREEYRKGAASLENVDTDIYIDRGTARSFDNHIRLMEIHSLDSLVQYGNGYFNIITN